MLLAPARPRAKPSQSASRHGFSSQRENDGESATMHYRARSYDPRTGRFLERDPEQERKLSSPYAYTKNQPTRFTDPTGMYEEDFHFYAVFFLARAAGLSHVSSSQIAGASQYADFSPNVVAPSDARWYTEYRASMLRTTRFHFVYDPDREGATRGNRYQVTEANAVVLGHLKAAMAIGSDIAVGIETHVLADSFSHAGFSGRQHPHNSRNPAGTGAPPIGHGQARFGGHAVDLAFRDVPKAIRAARAVYDQLSIYARSQGGQPRLAFADLESTLRTLFRKGDVEESDYKHDENLQLRIQAWKAHFRQDLDLYVNGVLDKSQGVPTFDPGTFEAMYGARFEARARAVMAGWTPP